MALVMAAIVSVAAQEPSPKPLDALLLTLSRIENPAAQANILRGMNASLKGRRDLAAPAGWEALYAKLKASPNADVRREAQALAVTFGGESALQEMRATLADASAKPDARRAALDSLLAVKDAPALPLVLALLQQSGDLRAPALRGLAAYDGAQIPKAILAIYPTLEAAEKRDALNTLLARPASARALLAAVDAGAVAKSDITAPLARQLHNIKDPEIEKWVAKNWGAVRTSSAEKQEQVAKFKKFLGPDAILRANAGHGRVLYSQFCAVCHTMFGEGARIGP